MLKIYNYYNKKLNKVYSFAKDFILIFSENKINYYNNKQKQ